MNRTGHPDWVKMFGDSNGQIELRAKQKYKFLSDTRPIRNIMYSDNRSKKIRAKKYLRPILFLVNFTKAFDSILRRKMEQILIVYGLPKETAAAIMMLYKNIVITQIFKINKI